MVVIERLPVVSIESRCGVPDEHRSRDQLLQLGGLLQYVFQRRLHEATLSDQITKQLRNVLLGSSTISPLSAHLLDAATGESGPGPGTPRQGQHQGQRVEVGEAFAGEPILVEDEAIDRLP